MQRRVAAIYFVFFLVMGASAYSVIALAETPAVEVPGETYGDGSSFTVDGQEYLVQVGTQQSSGGGHGGGGGTTVVGNLTYTNSSYRYTATLANNSTVAYDDDQYRVLIEKAASGENATRFTLRQSFNVSGMLTADPAVYNTTTVIEGQRYVTYRENDTNRPLDEYLPPRDSESFSEGDSLQYQGNETTVAAVGTSEVTLAWTGDRRQTIELSEGGNMTLSGTQYFAAFHGHGDSVRVTIAETQQHYDVYQNEVARQDYFHERMNGLWGVVILAGIAAFLIVTMALMPTKG